MSKKKRTLEVGMRYQVMFKNEEGEFIKSYGVIGKEKQTFNEVIFDAMKLLEINPLEVRFIHFVPEEQGYGRGFAMMIQIMTLY